jgi:DNA-binding NarL/FixJ family response regulator
MLEAVMLGARGVLLKTVESEVLLKCLREVALGGYWLEHGTIDGLVARLRGEEPGAASRMLQGGAAQLTPRERQVVAAVVGGASNADIGREMGVSAQTVKNHLSRIFDKLGVGTRLELAVYGLHHGLAGLPGQDVGRGAH